MADELVDIDAPQQDRPELARQLLDAAGDHPELVTATSTGFRVPATLAHKAGHTTDQATQQATDQPAEQPESGAGPAKTSKSRGKTAKSS